jgi:hypothetical protein
MDARRMLKMFYTGGPNSQINDIMDDENENENERT